MQVVGFETETLRLTDSGHYKVFSPSFCRQSDTVIGHLVVFSFYKYGFIISMDL